MNKYFCAHLLLIRLVHSYDPTTKQQIRCKFSIFDCLYLCNGTFYKNTTKVRIVQFNGANKKIYIFFKFHFAFAHNIDSKMRFFALFLLIFSEYLFNGTFYEKSFNHFLCTLVMFIIKLKNLKNSSLNSAVISIKPPISPIF